MDISYDSFIRTTDKRHEVRLLACNDHPVHVKALIVTVLPALTYPSVGLLLQLVVKQLLQKVWDKGDIYKAKYEGKSCMIQPPRDSVGANADAAVSFWLSHARHAVIDFALWGCNAAYCRADL